MTQQFDYFTIRPDGLDGKKASEYEATVLGMLRSYNATKMGAALLNGFRFLQREVLIIPHDGTEGTCNAVAYGTWGMFRTKISFTPLSFVGASACFPPNSGASAHEVLFHEMVHAMRLAADKFTLGQAREEQIAILVADVFSSEINQPLRDPAFHTFVNLQPTMTSADLLKSFGDVIRVFYHQHPEICRWIAEVMVPFNPFRTYYLTLRGVPRLRTAP